MSVFDLSSRLMITMLLSAQWLPPVVAVALIINDMYSLLFGGSRLYCIYKPIEEEVAICIKDSQTNTDTLQLLANSSPHRSVVG